MVGKNRQLTSTITAWFICSVVRNWYERMLKISSVWNIVCMCSNLRGHNKWLTRKIVFETSNNLVSNFSCLYLKVCFANGERAWWNCGIFSLEFRLLERKVMEWIQSQLWMLVYFEKEKPLFNENQHAI